MNKLAALCLLLLLPAAPADDPLKPFTGKVVKVTDGDTVHLLIDCTFPHSPSYSLTG